MKIISNIFWEINRFLFEITKPEGFIITYGDKKMTNNETELQLSKKRYESLKKYQKQFLSSLEKKPSLKLDYPKNFGKFTKKDKDKLQPSLIEPEFIEGMAKVLTFGAQKYSKDNWKKCEDKDRYKDALLRHILAYLKGEEKDEETGLSHLHHAACNLMFLEFMK